jgi:hypothetical protein
LTVVETNNQDIPPTRPFIHIPPLLLPDPHIARVGLRIRRWVHADPSHNARLHIRTFPTTVTRDGDTVLLPRRAITRARKLATTGETQRALQSWRGQRERRAGVWILLGRCDPGLRASLGVPLCCAVPLYAARRDRSLVRQQLSMGRIRTNISQGLAPPFKHALLAWTELLLHHHLPRLQRPALPPPHRAFTGPRCSYSDIVVRLIVWLQYVNAFCASVMGGR